MNLQRTQSVPLRPIRSGDGVPAPAEGPVLAGGETPFFRFDLARSLQLHRRLVLGFAIAGLVLAVIYVAISWPVYLAESQVYVQPVATKVMEQGNNNQRWPYDSNTYDSFIEQQVQNASNPSVLMGALDKLGPGPWLPEGESEEAAAVQLGRSLVAKRLGSSYQIAITAQAKNADSAARIANAVAGSLVEASAHEQDAGDAKRLTILKDEQNRVQTRLNADLTEQDALNKELGMAAVGTQPPDLIDNAIAATRNELIKARTDNDEAAANFAAMDASQGVSSAAIDAEADNLMSNDAGLTSMKTSLNQRRATLITQMANLTPNNPEYKLDTQELAKIESTLDSMTTELRAKAAVRIQEQLRTKLQQTGGVEARLDGQLRGLVATAASSTPKLQRANDLATDIVRLRNRYDVVDEELHNLMLQDSVPGAVHLSVIAVAPSHPAVSKVLRIALPLAFGGLLLGLLAALIANNLDPRVYIGSDIERLLGFAPMAQLPDFSEVSDGVAEEHLLRLSAAIEHARKQGDVKNCIFTGTG
ncbi:MAG: Wzz/FepE/Etk N-terminal domain-containing protein, partial [Terracidiphilus sp.]